MDCWSIGEIGSLDQEYDIVKVYLVDPYKPENTLICGKKWLN